MTTREPFRNFADWKAHHCDCPSCFRPSDRSTLSRTFLCFYSACVCRCMFRLCPRRAQSEVVNGNGG